MKRLLALLALVACGDPTAPGDRLRGCYPLIRINDSRTEGGEIRNFNGFGYAVMTGRVQLNRDEYVAVLASRQVIGTQTFRDSAVQTGRWAAFGDSIAFTPTSSTGTVVFPSVRWAAGVSNDIISIDAINRAQFGPVMSSCP
jgi:hypothetical protein